MNIGLRAQRLVQIHLDFDIGLEFDTGSILAINEFTVGDLVVDEDNQFEGMRALVPLLEQGCQAAGYDASGQLTVRFEKGTVDVAPARDEVESWECTAADGSTLLCEAGGVVVSFPAPDAAPVRRLGVGLPVADATVVKILVGRDPGVEFSDGSRLPIAVPLDDAYLILRETVASVRAGRVALSSSYQL